MRKWYKYFLYKGDTGKEFIPLDKNYIDFLSSSYNLTGIKQFYKNEKIFFEHYFVGRYVHWDEFLREHLSKDDEILSIASGFCINETKLLKDGFKITCSDLDMQTFYDTKKIFDDLRFIKLNVVNDKPHKIYDVIISLSLIYTFNDEQLDSMFNNVSNGLRIGGKFILDSAGSEDNYLSHIINDLYLCVESNLIYYVCKLIMKKRKLVKKDQGWRRTNQEIINCAQKYGLDIVTTKNYDYLTEFKRSHILNKLKIFDYYLMRKIFSFVGHLVPYIRMFKFIKHH